MRIGILLMFSLSAFSGVDMIQKGQNTPEEVFRYLGEDIKDTLFPDAITMVEALKKSCQGDIETPPSPIFDEQVSVKGYDKAYFYDGHKMEFNYRCKGSQHGRVFRRTDH